MANTRCLLKRLQPCLKEASTVFEDDLSLTGKDPDHSHGGEFRFITWGLSSAGRLLVVSIPSVEVKYTSSVLEPLRGQKGNSMKKPETQKDELRSEYKREDFGVMVRGKYAKRCKVASNVVVIEPDIQRAFPNTQAVNDALRSLLDLAQSVRIKTPRAPREPRKHA